MYQYHIHFWDSAIMWMNVLISIYLKKGCLNKNRKWSVLLTENQVSITNCHWEIFLLDSDLGFLPLGTWESLGCLRWQGLLPKYQWFGFLADFLGAQSYFGRAMPNPLPFQILKRCFDYDYPLFYLARSDWPVEQSATSRFGVLIMNIKPDFGIVCMHITFYEIRKIKSVLNMFTCINQTRFMSLKKISTRT